MDFDADHWLPKSACCLHEHILTYPKMIFVALPKKPCSCLTIKKPIPGTGLKKVGMAKVCGLWE